MPTHITWPHLLPVTLKLYAAQGIVQQGRMLEDFLRDEAAAVPADTLFRLATSRAPHESQTWAGADPPGESHPTPVETYFRRVGESLEQDLENWRRGKGGLPSETEGLLRRVCEKQICAECKAVDQGAKDVCAWVESTNSRDVGVLVTRGLCLDPAKSVFEFCAIAAQRAYKTHAQGAAIAELEFSTRILASANSLLGIAVGGKTREPVSGVGRREVILEIYPAGFLPRDYVAIAYVLMHECIAHGHCGQPLAGRGAMRAIAFHDGWMDRVAVEVLVFEVEQAQEGGSRSIVAQHGAEFIRCANAVHVRRLDYSGATGAQSLPLEWAAGARALDAFSSVVGWALKDLTPKGRTSPQEETIAVSLAINASTELDHLERKAFVDRILEVFGSTSANAMVRALGTTGGIAILRAVGEYLTHRDVVRMVRTVKAMPPT